MSMLSIIKKAGYCAAKYLGADAIGRGFYARTLLVLNYHGVVSEERVRDDLLETDDTYQRRNTVSLKRFRRQIQTVSRLFCPVSATDVADHITRGGGCHAMPSS